jgi:hypothetical protein
VTRSPEAMERERTPARGRWPVSPDEEIWDTGPFDALREFGRRAPLGSDGSVRRLKISGDRQPSYISASSFAGLLPHLPRPAPGPFNTRIVRADGRRFVETAPLPRARRPHLLPRPWPEAPEEEAAALRRRFPRSSRRSWAGGHVRIATDHADPDRERSALETVAGLERLLDALTPAAHAHSGLVCGEGRPIWVPVASQPGESGQGSGGGRPVVEPAMRDRVGEVPVAEMIRQPPPPRGSTSCNRKHRPPTRKITSEIVTAYTFVLPQPRRASRPFG